MAQQRPIVGSRRLISIIGGSIGNLVEWYDFYAYAAFALYFAPAFFPSDDRTSQLLGTAAVFAVGFLMRPLGAWWMGMYADSRGRKAGLTLSLILMFCGSALIALTPTHVAIGSAAPAILLFARMLQGISVGGEYGASATYLSEMAEGRNRGFWASFQYVTLIGGQLCALLVALVLGVLLSEAQIQAWGWRIPFAIGAVLALMAYGLRRRMAETDAFIDVGVDRPRSSLTALWRAYPTLFVRIAIVSGGGGLAFYAYTTYMQKFLVNSSGFSRGSATQIMTAALVIYMLAQPLAGHISDRFGRRPNMLAFAMLGTIATVPAFTILAGTQSAGAAVVIIVGLLLILTAYTAISGLFKAELFPPHIRALGVALPYAVGNALFGGTAEYVALSFKAAGMESGFYWYVAGAIAVTGVIFVTLPETRATSTEWELRGRSGRS
ncbi:MHS family alpha-ketoglutarate permease-like MFS transporter [Sphingomonas jinjuensis]|uniref:MHS family alpha-ketoglutarate permease-like MFS transporter n=1 Tax=Sphingomonas jinjuensis TaxID=535907 RepID=A0A840FFI6_9SPHN|nr:MFS transporter [Sphingomonas jinjuensis]MBB4152758.1 MHS family alpha-ketoglutarate permease-like MFS transporter [Sphingomonas jinjuensis]